MFLGLFFFFSCINPVKRSDTKMKRILFLYNEWPTFLLFALEIYSKALSPGYSASVGFRRRGFNDFTDGNEMGGRGTIRMALREALSPWARAGACCPAPAAARVSVPRLPGPPVSTTAQSLPWRRLYFELETYPQTHVFDFFF